MFQFVVGFFIKLIHFQTKYFIDLFILTSKTNFIMASTSETGHAKNVANFQDLIEFVTGYGATYNPSKSSLKLNNLITLKASAEGNFNRRYLKKHKLQQQSKRTHNRLQRFKSLLYSISECFTNNRCNSRNNWQRKNF